MTLVEKLGQIAVPDKGRWYELKHEPKVIRQILLAVAKEMPKFLKGYAEFLKHPSKTDEFERIDKLSLDMSKLYNNWLAQELRAEAEKLK